MTIGKSLTLTTRRVRLTPSDNFCPRGVNFVMLGRIELIERGKFKLINIKRS